MSKKSCPILYSEYNMTRLHGHAVVGNKVTNFESTYISVLFNRGIYYAKYYGGREWPIRKQN